MVMLLILAVHTCEGSRCGRGKLFVSWFDAWNNGGGGGQCLNIYSIRSTFQGWGSWHILPHEHNPEQCFLGESLFNQMSRNKIGHFVWNVANNAARLLNNDWIDFIVCYAHLERKYSRPTRCSLSWICSLYFSLVTYYVTHLSISCLVF